MRIGRFTFGFDAGLSVAVFLVFGVCSVPRPVLGLEPQSKSMIAFDGIWRSRGYGWIVSIRRSKFELYHFAGGTCVKDLKQDVFIPGDVYPGFVAGSNGSVMRASVDDSVYLHTFEKLGSLPDVCKQKADTDAKKVFDAVVDYFDAHYPFFKRRNINWKSLVSKYRSRIDSGSSDKTLYVVLKKMLSEIGDGHIELEAKYGGRKRTFESPNVWIDGGGYEFVPDELKAAVRGIVAGMPVGRWTSGIGTRLFVGDYAVRAKGKFSYGLIGDNVGYLAITAFEGIKRKHVDKIMRDVVKTFDGARAVIVDVSSNDGGHDSVSRQVASYFTNERTLAFYKYPGDDETAKPQGLYIEPAKVTVDRSIPVFVVTGRETYSAAEVFVLAMRALPNVTHVGEPTAGIMSDTLWKRLPNGWYLSLSNEVYLDHKRKLWEAVGISPEIAIDVDDDGDVSRDDVSGARSVVRYLLSNARS